MRTLVYVALFALALFAMDGCIRSATIVSPARTDPTATNPASDAASSTTLVSVAGTSVTIKLVSKVTPLPKEPPVDNSRCHVCHLNYQMDTMAVKHAEAGIGCEKCHGSSDAHAGDENNVTPPDAMYGKDKINAFCFLCHTEMSVIHRKILAGTFDRKYCTECHGDHRLARRTRVWDKNTGRLLFSDQVAVVGDEAVTTPTKPLSTSGNPAID